MDKEQFKLLGEKVARNQATAEERLAFVTEMNNLITEMRDDIKKIKQS